MSQEWHLGGGSWHIISVLCYIMYICAFISQRSVIFYNVLWFPPAFCGIKLVSGSYHRFMILLNHYIGFCWFITMDSVILDYRSRWVKIPRTQFQNLIRCLIVRSREVSKPRDLCLIALKFDRHLSNSAKTHSIKEYRQTHEYAHQDLKNSL